MMTSSEPLDQQHREEFWRRMGWSPDLPEERRRAIEEEFDDASIREAEAFGF